MQDATAIGASKRLRLKLSNERMRHTAISEAVRKVQAVGMDVTKVLQFPGIKI